MALKDLKIKSKNPKNIEDEEEFVVLDEELSEDDEDDEDFEDLEDLEDDDEDEDDEDPVDEDEDLEDEEDDDDDDEDEEEEVIKPKAPSRENDRIRALIEGNKVQDAALKKERESNLKLKKDLVAIQRATQKSNTKLLEDSITGIKAQMASAQEEGETGRFIDLQENLQEAMINLNAIRSIQIEDAPEEIIEVPKEKIQNQPPAVMQSWLDGNSWFTHPKSVEDVERQKAASDYADILTKAGLTLDSQELFDMVDKRLDKLGLANTSKNKVKSKKRKTSSNKIGRKKAKKISQTVQGASRTPRSKSKRNKIVLTEEQKKIADLYDLTHVDYAKELLTIENSKKAGNRMTTLNLNN